MEIPNPNGVTGKKTVRPIYTTQAQENELRRIINDLIRQWRLEISRILTAYQGSASIGRMEIVISQARTRSTRTFGSIEAKLKGFLAAQELFHRSKWVAQVEAISGFDLGPVLSQKGVNEAMRIALKRNVSLIKGLDDEIAKKVSNTVWDAYAKGAATTKLVKSLRDNMKFTPARAKLIARDQLGSLNAELTKVRHQEAGVKSFVWETSGDERVRAEHDALDGKEFTYARPPSEGLPGEPINCRCVASAVLVFKKEKEEVFQ